MIPLRQDLIIDPSDPFKLDVLNRSMVAKNLTRIFEDEKGPLVLSISGPWGCGKTTFVRMWKASLDQADYRSIYFNAWENDWATDPLTSFIGHLKEVLDKHPKGTSDSKPLQSLYDKVRGGLKKVVAASPRIAVAYLTKGIIRLPMDDAARENASSAVDAVSEIAANMVESELNKQESVRRVIDDFKGSLREFAAVVTGGGSPLLVFIDELDRCRPSFALELLERIKHLFSVAGVVFILVLDREQMVNAASTLYGAGTDGDGYLRKFIDFDFRLPVPENEDFARYLAQRFHLTDEAVQIYEVVSSFTAVATWLGLPLRAQEQCFLRLAVMFRAFKRLYHPIGRLLVFFIAMEPRYANEIAAGLSGKTGSKALLDAVNGMLTYQDERVERCGCLLKGYLLAVFADQTEVNLFIAGIHADIEKYKVVDKTGDSLTPESRIERIRRQRIFEGFRAMQDYIAPDRCARMRKVILETLNFTSSFHEG